MFLLGSILLKYVQWCSEFRLVYKIIPDRTCVSPNESFHFSCQMEKNLDKKSANGPMPGFFPDENRKNLSDWKVEISRKSHPPHLYLGVPCETRVRLLLDARL